MNTSETNIIIDHAKAFASVGGMESDSTIALALHETLADAIESASDYESALAIANSIVNNFDY